MMYNLKSIRVDGTLKIMDIQVMYIKKMFEKNNVQKKKFIKGVY